MHEQTLPLQVSYFIPGPLEYKDEYIEVSDGNHVTAKQKGQVQLRMCNDNVDSFITTLNSVLLASDLCDTLFSIVTLMNLVHTCLFNKWF